MYGEFKEKEYEFLVIQNDKSAADVLLRTDMVKTGIRLYFDWHFI